MWKVWTRIREAYDWGERSHFGWHVIWPYLKETFGLSTGAGVLMAVLASFRELSWFGILCSGLLGFVVVSVGYIAITQHRLNRRNKEAKEGEQTIFADAIPDLRVADSPSAVELFEGRERDKLFPLLETEKLMAWARPMYSGLPPGSGNAPLARLPGATWAGHVFFNYPSDGSSRMINQTFIRTKGRLESKWYDIHLNRMEIGRLWPAVASEPPKSAQDHIPDSAQSSNPIVDWKLAPDAVEAFAEEDLIAKRDKERERFEVSCLKRHDAEEELRKLYKTLPNAYVTEGSEEEKAIRRYQMQIKNYGTLERLSEPELRRAWDELRADLHKKLVVGDLVAKGFREPHVSGGDEVEISSAEWRILTLDNVNSTARTKDHGVAYSGLLIRKS
jgi:hypothetical protein